MTEKKSASYLRYYAKHKTAIRARNKRWHEANKEKARAYSRKYNREQARVKDLKEKFGLTPEEYARKLTEQNHVCAICLGEDKRRSLSVDHNHLTDQVRGLLCSRCNMAIGALNEDIALLHNAISYLKKWETCSGPTESVVVGHRNAT